MLRSSDEFIIQYLKIRGVPNPMLAYDCLYDVKHLRGGNPSDIIRCEANERNVHLVLLMISEWSNRNGYHLG